MLLPGSDQAADPVGEDLGAAAGELAQSEQVVRLEERDAVLEVQPLARLDLLADRRQRLDAVEDGHHESRFTTACVSASSSSRRGAPFRQARARSAYSSASSRE